MLGKTVTVGKNKVNGVIGVKPIHLSKSDERTAVPKYGEMYIDIGATSKDDALSVVSYGDSVNFNSIYENNGYTIKSKAIDDRFGCLALIELIKSELEYDMHFVFAVQEEVGLRGAKVAAYSVDLNLPLLWKPQPQRILQVLKKQDRCAISVTVRLFL